MFIACECPISQKYIVTLNELYSQYSGQSQLRWRFIVPERVTKQELREFVKEYQVKFPIERDSRRHAIVQKFNADVTPQVVMLRENDVLYSGAIDNWFYGLGQYRQIITENYLKDALEAVLNGKTPSVKKTDAVGCPIARR